VQSIEHGNLVNLRSADSKSTSPGYPTLPDVDGRNAILTLYRRWQLAYPASVQIGPLVTPNLTRKPENGRHLRPQLTRALSLHRFLNTLLCEVPLGGPIDWTIALHFFALKNGVATGLGCPILPQPYRGRVGSTKPKKNTAGKNTLHRPELGAPGLAFETWESTNLSFTAGPRPSSFLVSIGFDSEHCDPKGQKKSPKRMHPV